MNELFSAFKKINLAEWLIQIEKDLKGKPLDLLNSKPEPDLEVSAIHHADNTVSTPENDLSRNLYRKDNSWRIRQYFNESDPNDLNKIILSALNDGVDAIGFSCDTPEDYLKITKDVLFEHIASDITITNPSAFVSTKFDPNTRLNFDILANHAALGKNDFDFSDFISFYKTHLNNATVFVNGSIYGEAGASTIQELAITISHLNEYLHALVSEGIDLETINSKLTIQLAVNDNYFVNVAKFRVIRELVQLVFSAYDSTYKLKAFNLSGVTSLRHHARNDHHNNLLRATTQAMSSIIGGAELLTIQYLAVTEKKELEFQRRMSKNVQLILKEESHFAQVKDASGGSYYIENLTEQLLEKSWILFQDIENKGGLIVELKANNVQAIIQTNKDALIADLNSGKKTFLGINKYKNATEEWIATEPKEQAIKNTDFTPIELFRLEEYYKEN
ncbi:methylmalonyl-CoA mutase family protein [Crocinitomix catalasitica]|uniref:methylmalonyl-CoA mutase family protein n=1 Tax=Crocinitomix catalasitica TaxID=184607 RepID=UPI000482971D|nr:methylmalonyl-CoA mutase family protein [Crocinitomix catalasitica]